MVLTKKRSIRFQQPSYKPSSRLQRVLHMYSKASSTWSQTQGHRAIIKPRMPLAYPPESKIGTRH
jgi:hypothetical protein